jgi:hypothetical protein
LTSAPPDLERYKSFTAHPLYQPSASQREDLRVVRFGEPIELPLRYMIFHDVLIELERVFRADERRASALLIGGFRVDELGPYVEISGFERVNQWAEDDDLGKLLRRDLEAMMEEPVASKLSTVVVGWALHSPGSDAALLEDAMRAHLTLFNIPLQCLLVLDLSADQIACYTRLPRERFLNPPIDVILLREQ